MSEKKKTPKKISSKYQKAIDELDYEIDVDQLLLHSRDLFLYGEITEKSAYKINKQLLALAKISSDPIAMWINSCGGSCSAGWAIIDTMRGLKCPVLTFVNGSAMSMAGLISIAGHKRVITTNSTWMGHEARTFGGDYITKILDREAHYKVLDKQIQKHLKKYTRLNAKDLDTARKGELWLTATQCKSKGIVDVIARV